MAANRWHYENCDLFFPWSNTGGFQGFALDNATTSGGYSNDTWAIGFVARESKTLNAFRVYFVSVTGSPAASEIVCSLYTATADKSAQNTLIETVQVDSIASGWRTFSGFTTALTAGEKYFLVVRNANATPATNYVTLQSGQNISFPLGSGHAHNAVSVYTSTTGIGALSSNISFTTGFRLGWSDGTYSGQPSFSLGASSSSYRIYDTRELGTLLTFDAAMRLPIVGVAGMVTTETGNPTGDLRWRVYDGTTLLGTTQVIKDAQASYSTSYNRYVGYFDDVVQFDGTQLRIVGGVTSGGDSTNAHNLPYLDWDSDSDSLALRPYAAKLTYYDGSSWSEPVNGFIQTSLLVDWTQLPAAGGGGGLPFRNAVFG